MSIKTAGCGLIFGLAVCCATASAQTPVGYLSWDLVFPGNAGEFDITNLTGPNDSGDATFPIATELQMSVLNLVVNFAGGSSETFGPASGYFSLGGDGESWNGTAIPIGGTNPTPVSATLTGVLSPTTSLALDVPGGPINISPAFTVFLSHSVPSSLGATTPILQDGDLAIINANPAVVTGTPEPGTWLMLATGLLLLMAWGRKSAFKAVTGFAAKGLLPVLCLVAIQSAYGQVKLTVSTTPSSGVAGTTNVNINGSLFPSGTITPANVVVAFETSCGVAPVLTTAANSVVHVLGSNDRVNVSIPGTGLAPGTHNYFLQLSDSAAGDAHFTSTNCTEVQVTASSAVLNACVAGSSVGVLLPAAAAPGNVTAYVPNGYWEGSATGVVVKNIEGTLGAGTTVPTVGVPNSCSSNPATGQTVCVANNTDVYLISGTTLTNTLTSGSNTTASFSGGSCNNCGVALNANNNTAVINMGVVGASDGGVQILNLNNNTFSTPFPMVQEVSENISVDPTRSLILTAGEAGNFTILQLQSNGSLLEFASSFSSSFTNDSSAEDCSTGIGITPGEFTSSVQLVNLNAISFGSGTYTAPNSIATLVTDYSFSAGLSGSAVAQGSGHLAVVTGEFGGDTFAVLKLPPTASGATPSLVDYAVAEMPATTTCAGGSFNAGFDPHTITAYTSPNTGDSMAVFAGYSSSVPVCLAVVDMTTVIGAPRGGGGLLANDVAAADLPPSAVTFFPLP